MIDTDVEKEPSVHVEEQIYSDFTGYEDRAIVAEFHKAAWAGRADLLGSLSDARLKVLGERLFYTEAPDAMAAPDRRRHEAELAKRLMADEGTVPWRTLPQALREAEALLAGSPADGASILKGLRDYLVGRAGEAGGRMA